MNTVRGPVNVPAGLPGQQPNVGIPKRPPATGYQPAAQAPLGLQQLNALRHPATGGMAPRSGQLPVRRFQNDNVGAMPANPLPQVLPQTMAAPGFEAQLRGRDPVQRQPLRQQLPVVNWLMQQVAALFRQQIPQAPKPGYPQVPPQPGQAVPMPGPVAANHVQPQAGQLAVPMQMQVQNPGAYPGAVRPLRPALPQWPQQPQQPMVQQPLQHGQAVLHALLPYGGQVPPRPVLPWHAVVQQPTPQEMAQVGQAMLQAWLPAGHQEPAQPLPAGQWPTLQEAAQAGRANPHAMTPRPGRPQRPSRPGQGVPMHDQVQVAANHVQPQGPPLQVQNPGAYPVHVRPPRNGKPLLQAQQPAVNVPTGKLPLNIGRLYQQLNLKVTDDTKPAFTNANLMGQPTKLGSGAFNTVFAVKLEKPDGSRFDGVFKPLGNVENGWVAAATGIPKHDPQIAMRNIATLSYAQKLGIDVIPDTRVAVLGTDLDGPKLGLVMERARGKEAAKADPALFNRTDVRAEVTKLQLLDHLTGQGDRHGSNYFIDIGQDGKAKVTGIDNDQCFGARLTDPNGIQYMKGRTNWGFRGTSLPPVVDTEMAAKIHALTHSDIREMLGSKLSEPEVQAAIARHEGVKQHIAGLAAQGRVIRPSDWNHPAVTNLLTAQNSYVGRERENAARMAGRQPNAGWQ